MRLCMDALVDAPLFVHVCMRVCACMHVFLGGKGLGE